jgi:hypothetical protein
LKVAAWKLGKSPSCHETPLFNALGVVKISAGMAELADAADSKSADRKVMGVRFPLPAPIESILYEINASSDAFFYA